jgi:ribosomal protein L15
VPTPTTGADRRDELSAAPQPRGRGKHGNGSGLRRRGGYGPCGAVRR